MRFSLHNYPLGQLLCHLLKENRFTRYKHWCIWMSMLCEIAVSLTKIWNWIISGCIQRHTLRRQPSHCLSSAWSPLMGGSTHALVSMPLTRNYLLLYQCLSSVSKDKGIIYLRRIIHSWYNLVRCSCRTIRKSWYRLQATLQGRG